MYTIRETIEYYKKNIDKYWDGEGYKWVGLKHFRDNWDADATDFPKMIEEALGKANNLLSGARYLPYKMTCKFAKAYPEKIKHLFDVLYDENILLSDRIKTFKDGYDELLKDYSIDNPKAKNHYQDLRAICVYLSFMYPEKYYLYKSSMYKAYIKTVDYSEISTNSNLEIRKYENFNNLCQKIIDEVVKDPELIEMQRERENSSPVYFKDDKLHLLAQTIIYVWATKYGEKTADDSAVENGYLPSLEEYPVDISKDEWKKFLTEVEYPIHKGCMRVLKCIVDIGGEASPKKLSEVYKGHPTVYTSSVMNTSRRAAKFFDTEPWSEETGDWFFTIAFQYKLAGEKEKGNIIYKMRDELFEAIKEMNLDDIELEYTKDKKNMTNTDSIGIGLNTILYGPPGTGKTYHLAYYAVAICDNIPIEDVVGWDREEVLARYNELKKEDRIAFTTFHQSFGYEEFIEGIRPVMEEESAEDSDATSGGLKYKIESGIFKKFCDLARNSYISEKNADWGLNDNPTIWKVSLEGTGDNDTRTECLKNGHIRIGWDEYGSEIDWQSSNVEKGKNVLNAYYYKMKKGDIVVSCYSSEVTDAIGVVTGDVEWDDSFAKYKRVRKVKWLVKDIRENILKLNDDKPMVLASVYKMGIPFEEVMNIVKKHLNTSEKPVDKKNKKNYVFIIDEINRGNIPKIFGELITLIESSKREGSEEEIRVKLPYSGQMFGVPDNVYILGTMNTADRSIALMDTALRRRFQFIEMMPEIKLLEGVTITSNGESLNVAKMLEIINKRIEFLYDREHTIGHAFFTILRTIDNPRVSDLGMIFKKSIIPLLQEYFYEDYEKIRLVLGDNAKKDAEIEFVVAVPPEMGLFRGNVTDEDYKENIYRINENAFNDLRSYKGISEDL